MTQFTTEESGLFSAAEYEERSNTLTVVFRSTGKAYDVPGVSKAEASEFMSMQGKSAYWHAVLKHKGPVER